MFDKNLVDALIGGKDLDCGSAELSLNLGLTRGHGSLLLARNNTSERSANLPRTGERPVCPRIVPVPGLSTDSRLLSRLRRPVGRFNTELLGV